MKKISFLLFVFLIGMNSSAQQSQQLEEMVITPKKAKLFKVSKGKKPTKYHFNYKYDTYLYFLEALPYGILQELTVYPETNYVTYNVTDKKNAKKVFKEWCNETFFDVMLYVYDEGNLVQIMDDPLPVSFEKNKKFGGYSKKIDFSKYNLAGSQFVMSVTPSTTKHHCGKCPIYGISLFENKEGSLYNYKIQEKIKGKELKYDIVIRSRNYE